MNKLTRFSHAPAQRSPSRLVRVWDPLVRLFHWCLVVSFLVAFLTEDDLLFVHAWAGYIVLGLILLRLIWGLVGPQHARWTDFVRTPDQIVAYLKDAVRFRATRYLGHNPAGGAMVVALLISLAATGLTGLALYEVYELSGPLASIFGGIPGGWGHVLEDVHEVMANLTLLLVVVHLAGVLFASLQHRENLVRSMVNGMKRRNA